jgi:HD-GYP domain-containing protein (c-di-GMP phosphodiesterase class II)
MMETSRIDIDRMQVAGQDELTFVNSFFILLRTAQMVDADNATYVTQSSRFYVNFRKLVEEHGKVSVKIIEGRIVVGDRLVRLDSDGMVRAREIIDSWRMIGIGGIILDDFLDNRQIDKFIYLIANIGRTDIDLETISNKLAHLGIEGITLLGIEDHEEKPILPEEKRLMMRRAARATFFRAITIVEDVMVQAAHDKEIDTSKTKRVVHSLIDHISEDENTLIELTNIRDFDEYTYAHCANVCVYSLTIGIKIGLDRKRLSQLGFAALFHDIGKIRLPEDLIRKPDAYDENDWMQMIKHPILGAKTILRNFKLDAHTARAALVAFEHHINIDYTGYPSLKKKRMTNLFSRIVTIADAFDALTSGRVYIKKKIQPDEVLRKMMYQMNVKFDSFLLKLFINTVGIYPPGTLVLLSSRELAVVSRNNAGNLSRPLVRVIGNQDGTFEKFIETDLSLPENQNKQIIKIIDPEKYNVDIKSIILRDT